MEQLSSLETCSGVQCFTIKKYDARQNKTDGIQPGCALKHK